MMSSITSAWLSLGVLILAGTIPASAGVALDVYPNTTALSDTMGSVAGNSSSAPGFGDGGSWQATGIKSNYYVTPMQLFGHDVLISDIKSITYWTDQKGTAGNWNLYIYTTPEGPGTGDSASWYRSVLVGITPDGGAGWNFNSTVNPNLDFSDPKRNGNAYTTPITLADLIAGQVTWPTSHTSHDYSGETVEFFSMQTDSGATAFRGLVDGMTVNLASESASVNFETTPEPATYLCLGLGLAGLGIIRRFRK